MIKFFGHSFFKNYGKILCCLGWMLCSLNTAFAQTLPNQSNNPSQTLTEQSSDENASSPTDTSSLPKVGTPEYKLEAEKGQLFKTCGEKNPYGCSDGSQCYRVTTRSSSSTSISTGITGTVTSTTSTNEVISWECLASGSQIPMHEKESDPIYELREEGSLGIGTITRYNIYDAFPDEEICDTAGNCKKYKGSNSACEIGRMKAKYQTTCYSCLVVKTLLSEFMKIGDKTYSLCRDAAVKILFLCSALWLAFFVLKNVSSFTSIEPANFVNQLFSQLFKIVVAYAIIVSGADTFITYVVNPIMDAGADYGLGIIKSTEQSISTEVDSQYAYTETNSLLSNSVLNKILALNQGIDRIVSTNLVIGHGLTCHSVNAGKWTISLGFFSVHIVNLWIWLCGAVIWFLGFMMTLSIAYYLVDISFKIGIAIIIFPITIALWPFSFTKDRVKACISTIFMSAATFAFLALTASYATLLISSSLRDISTLEQKLKDGDSQWISETFDITGPYFLIILFAFLYSLKLIESTIPSYVSLFFSGGIAAKLSPMHMELTRATDVAKKSAVGTGKYVKDVASHQGAKATKGLAKGLGKVGTIRFVHPQQQSGNQSGNSQSGNNQSGNNQSGGNQSLLSQITSGGVETAGKGVEAAGKGVEAAGKGISAAGKGIGAAGKGISAAGTALSSTGLGAIIGIPLKAIGIATQAAGKGVEAAGKATQTAGKTVKTAGKTMKQTGKVVKNKPSSNNNQQKDDDDNDV